MDRLFWSGMYNSSWARKLQKERRRQTTEPEDKMISIAKEALSDIVEKEKLARKGGIR